MSAASGQRGALQDPRVTFSQRLRARFPEIEQSVLNRVYAVAPPDEGADSEYLNGLRAAIPAAIEYWIAVIEGDSGQPPPIPVTLLAQARMAARHAIPLETVLQRYFSGYTLLEDFLLDEAEDQRPGGSGLRLIMRAQSVMLGRLLAALIQEYEREVHERIDSRDARRVARVRGLLAGELLDPSELDYDFDAHHIGLIAKGPDAPVAVRELAGTLDGRLLLVHPGDDTVWAWLGSRRKPPELHRLTDFGWPAEIRVALGEPAESPTGWRQTHRQAKTAFGIAMQMPTSVCRYADVALVASIANDALLAKSLWDLYLAPLAQERGRGSTLRKTLRAYFASRRNVVSAAARLGISRQTVANHLKAVERQLAKPLASCETDLEIALRLAELVPPPA